MIPDEPSPSVDLAAELVVLGTEALGPDTISLLMLDFVSPRSSALDDISRNLMSLLLVLSEEETCLLPVNERGRKLEQLANKARKTKDDKIVFSIISLKCVPGVGFGKCIIYFQPTVCERVLAVKIILIRDPNQGN